ncbi:DUF1501 domain-containing protein [Aureibaculum marinum]|uniref:DUF1501 domain-containing protein n=1 Tax=Aureibaculum marinum TaxID=2487930 RepID=A0A3N4NX54_9FLAO|nr:DUF1501 domain-containing protein [Aureibaculum marinum]RPD96159.1 DUF1501 domain-containing protein [Aureibaculum marinum]
MCTDKNHPSCNKEDHKKWDRRSFLQTLGLGGAAATLMMNGIPMAYGQPTALTRALSKAESGRVLLIIRLQGGNDGLNTIVPIYDYDSYAKARPTLKHELTDLYRLSNDFAMPNYLQDSLEAMWECGSMKVVHGTGYENMNLSHFTGTDNFSRGTDDELVETGVYGNYFENIYPDFLLNLPEAPPAVQIGGVGDIIFKGNESNFAFTIANTNQLERIVSEGSLYNIADVPDCTRGDQLKFVRGLVNTTLKYSGVIKAAAETQTNSVEFPDTSLGRSLAIISKTIQAGMNTSVYMVNLNGFDTHANQPDKHQELLTNISESIQALYEDLVPSGRNKDVLTMTMSEFGRRVKQNGSNGTDHGTAAPMLLFGPALNGSGFVGEHPSLTNLTRGGNLNYTQDFINVYGTVMQDWLCIDQGIINKSLPRPFEPLDLGFDCDRKVVYYDCTTSEKFEHTAVYDQNQVFVRINNNEESSYKISLYNIIGQQTGILFDGNLEAGQHDINITERWPSLAPGIYIYSINKNNKNYSSKIIVGQLNK